ncbi:hypothetical protein NGI46_27465, partial [Peribacillus butanolivorans]|uniref:5'-methylthioadenosine/S-adenosylhomocysteine nucleosidase family protein n=1 Tax=Peribacillus butanolivorans TaxID=421767 RepID=UPI00207C2777
GISINNASDKLMGQYILLNNELQNSFSKWNDFEDFEPVLKTLRKNGWNNSAIGALIKDRVAFKIFYEAKEVIDFLMFSYPSFAKENNIELLIVSISTNRDVPFEPILTENVYEQIKNTIRTPYPNSNSVAILQLESTPTADYNFEEIKHFNEVDVLNNQEGFQVDIAVVAALKKELQPLLDIKDIKWDKEPKGKEFNTYYKGTFIKGGSEVSIVATYCPQMGMAASTLVSMDMINKFRPKYLAMIGIAAGVSGGEIKLGDILVAETSFDYGSGKVVTNDDGTSSFLAHYKQIPIDLDILGSLDSDHEQILKNIYISYMDMDKGELPPQLPKMRIGPVASGAMVVAHEDIIKEIKSHERKLIGIDMETYGVYFAARYAPKQIKPTFFSIKAVCDFADEKKGDKFHSYACFVSANFLFQFFLNEEI